MTPPVYVPAPAALVVLNAALAAAMYADGQIPLGYVNAALTAFFWCATMVHSWRRSR